MDMDIDETRDDNVNLNVFDPASGAHTDTVLKVMEPPTDQGDEEKIELKNLQGSMKIENFTHPNLSSKITPSMEKLVGTQIHKNIIDSQCPVDTIFACSDGKVGAHRVILFAASPLLGYLFKTHKLDEITTIVVPDISSQVMIILIQLCYIGSAYFPPELENEVMEGMQALMIAADGDLNKKTFTVKTDPKPVENLSDLDYLESVKQENSPQEKPSAQENGNAKENSGDEEVECKGNKEAEESINDQLKSVCKAVFRFETYITEGKYSDVNFYCTSCETTFSKKHSMQKHIATKHSNEFNSFDITCEEHEKLRQCSLECKDSHTTIFATDDCLKKNGNTRCYTCFEIYPSEEIANHYRLAHGITSKFGLVVKCRWCDIGVEISTNGSLVLRHARNVHITRRIGPPNVKSKLHNNNNKQLSTTPSKRRAPPSEEEQSTSHTILSPTTAFDETIKLKVQSTPMKRKTPLKLNKGQPNANAGTLLPFLKMYQDNLKKEDNKRRKMDENGIPLQTAKKTGKPCKLILRDATGKIIDIKAQDFEKFRKLQIILNKLSEAEIEKLTKKETQNIVPQQLQNQDFDNQTENESKQLPDEFFAAKTTISPDDCASHLVDNLF